MRTCARCEREPHKGALLCARHVREALRSIRRDAAEREDLLLEEDPDAEEHG